MDLSKLKVFSFTPDANLLFCATCSTPMFWASPKVLGSSLRACTGALTNDDMDLVRFTDQWFTGDTVDGGASVWLQHANGDGSGCSRSRLGAKDSASEEKLPHEWPPAHELVGFDKKTEESVPVRCRCKGVDFVLRRGNYEGIPKDKLPCNIDPETHKLSTVFCGCDSCRLQGGYDMWYWAYTNLELLSAATMDTPFPRSKHELKEFVDRKDPAVGSLAYFASKTKAGVLRFFCSTCSATVFFAEDERPELIDISVGLIDAPDGARAEGFLSWSLGPIEFKKDADGGWRAKHFDSISKEADEWRARRGYPKNWRCLGGGIAQS